MTAPLPQRTSPRVAVITLRRLKEDAHHVRHEAARLLADLTTNESTVSDALAALAELLANSVQHGAGDETTVRIDADGERIRVEVTDAFTGPLDDADDDLLAESGRGLLIVAALCDNYGITQTSTATTVWFTKQIGAAVPSVVAGTFETGTGAVPARGGVRRNVHANDQRSRPGS